MAVSPKRDTPSISSEIARDSADNVLSLSNSRLRHIWNYDLPASGFLVLIRAGAPMAPESAGTSLLTTEPVPV